MMTKHFREKFDQDNLRIKIEERALEYAGDFNDMAVLIYQANKMKGFWDGGPELHNKAEKIALMHSELSEALEGTRKNTMDDHLPHRKTEEVELADAVIRIMDYAGAHALDVGGALVQKLLYNLQRPHKHGKAF